MSSRLPICRLASLACLLSGCTGLAFASSPGGDGPSSSLSTGGIAVDPRTETAFVLRTASSNLSTPGSGGDAGSPGGPVYAIAPDTGDVTKLVDLSTYQEVGVIFPEDSVLVVAEEGTGGGSTLMRFDDTTLAKTNTMNTSAQYWGTRTSPSGKYLAVADNSQVYPPIHVIDTNTLDPHVLAAGGLTLEAMWLRTTDTLIAAYFPAGDDEIGSGRLVAFSIPDLAAKGFPTGTDGMWSSATLDVTVPNVGFDELFSYTWVGISPDDSLAVFPVLTGPASATSGLTHELLVMSTSDGSIRTVPNAYGPVGFTPDGTTIVSYNYTAGGASELLLVDAKTLVATKAPIPSGAAPSYYVTSEGNNVVIASNLGSTALVVYDVSNHTLEKVGAPPLGLNDFVERTGFDQLWLVDDGLYDLDFAKGTLSSVALSFTPLNVDILPKRDLLVLDDANSGDIRYFDPSTLSVTRTVHLPGQVDP
jgi:hypothetical protein